MNRSMRSEPARFTRWGITLGLGVGGAVAGAIAGLALTPIGKFVADAPPADLANYLWNAWTLGVVGAVSAPTVIWSALRHVPLWRTIAEPLTGAVVGAGAGALIGSGPAFLLLMPLGAAAAVARLHLSHRSRGGEQASSPPRSSL
jgi:hypothetical protein